MQKDDSTLYCRLIYSLFNYINFSFFPETPSAPEQTPTIIIIVDLSGIETGSTGTEKLSEITNRIKIHVTAMISPYTAPFSHAILAQIKEATTTEIYEAISKAKIYPEFSILPKLLAVSTIAQSNTKNIPA